jgi:hypothetical protein
MTTITMTKAEAEKEYARLDSLTTDEKRASFKSFKEYNEACCKCLDITMTEEEKQMVARLK